MSLHLQSIMIRASAGSGKTWQLANRYLGLMVLGVAPEKIIALTFTRKAAGEFTSRIMTRLAEGASNEQSAIKLARELTGVIQGTHDKPGLVTGDSQDQRLELPDMGIVFFQKLLRKLVDALDRLALSTLDSYFVRIVRNFSLELGLSGFDLMEDSAVATERMAVMSRIFSSSETTAQERLNFLQSFKQATWGEEENRLSATLQNFIESHQNRWLSAPEEEKWGNPELLWPQTGCPLPEGGNYIPKAQRVLTLLGGIENIHGSYKKSWISACDWMERRIAGTSLSSLPKRIAEAMKAMPELQSGKWVEVFSKREQILEGELAEAVYEMVGALVRDEIEIRIKRTQGLHAVISAYEHEYHERVRSRGRLCFSDLTLLLAGQGAMAIWDPEQRDLIDFRLDSKHDHWLLDEFQDTSQPQWQAVGRLIDEILQDDQGDRSVFVVGDSKQSIYGWRGGEPRLFNELRNFYGDRFTEWNMDKSFRSSAHVLDLVNCVCNLQDPKWSEIFPAEAVERWVFQDHEPSDHKEGHAMVFETSIDPKAAMQEKTDARYAAVKDLLEETKPLENGRTCAILVSKNSQAMALVDYLRCELPELLVAPESESYATDGPEGAVILDLFRWLNNPLDKFARLHVSFSPLHQIIGKLTETTEPVDQWTVLTQDVAKNGVVELLQTIITMLYQDVQISEYGESRLNEILAAANEFSVMGGSLSDWIQFLENRKIRETSREDMIQVMTVHKAKGLGFDMVILPELGGQGFAPTNRLEMLERKGDLGKIDFLIRKPAKEICQADARLQAMLEAWGAEQSYERFCTLYVALTRAKHATYCILDPVRDKWTPADKYDDWIREATARYEAAEMVLGETSYRKLYESGQWLQVSEPLPELPKELPIPVKLKKPQPRIARRIASAQKEGQIGDLLGGGKGAVFGNIVHQHFEKITWLDELPELDDHAAAQRVKECLQVPEIAKFFERPTGEYRLLREQPFETQVDGAWLSGVIDRAVITWVHGKAVSVEIIDFKTDNKSSAELRELYSGQLRVYRRAMASITSVPFSNISCYLLSTHLKEMVEL